MSRIKVVLKKLWIMLELVVILSFIYVSVVSFLQMRNQSLYAASLDFSKTLAQFVSKEQRLPFNLLEFCQWKENGEKNPFEDFANTKRYVDLNPLTLNDAIHGSAPYIIMKDKRIKCLENVVNDRFRNYVIVVARDNEGIPCTGGRLSPAAENAAREDTRPPGEFTPARARR